MASFEQELARAFAGDPKRFTAKQQHDVEELLDKYQWAHHTGIHHTTSYFINEVWAGFVAGCNNAYVMATARLIGFIIVDGGVSITFARSRDDVSAQATGLESLVLRLIQQLKRPNSGIELRSMIVKAFSALTLNLADAATRLAMAPFFSILVWEYAAVEDEQLEKYGLRDHMASERERRDKLKGRDRNINDLFVGFIPGLVDEFTADTKQDISYLTEVLNFFNVILSQLPSRRFLRVLFETKHVLLAAEMPASPPTDLNYLQALKAFRYILESPVDEFTGDVIPDEELVQDREKRITLFSVHAPGVIEDPCTFDDPVQLKKLLNGKDLDAVLKHTSQPSSNAPQVDQLVQYLSKRLTFTEIIENHSPLPTTEDLIINGFTSPIFEANCQSLSLQDVFVRDYLSHSHASFQLISKHLRSVLLRLEKKRNNPKVQGSSKYAVKIKDLKFLKEIPGVRSSDYAIASGADVNIDLKNSNGTDVQGWNSLKTSDVVLFVELCERDENSSDDIFAKIGLKSMQAATIINTMNDDGTEKKGAKSKKFTIRARFDPHSFKLGEDIQKFDLLVRLPATVSNYKSKLDLISKVVKSSSNSDLPSWLLGVVLGYGGDSQPTSSVKQTFSISSFGVSPQDLIDALAEGGATVETVSSSLDDKPRSKKRKTNLDPEKDLIVDSLTLVDGKYSITTMTKKEGETCGIQLNGSQLRAVAQSAFEGLTLINGSNGTGKKTIASLLAKANVSNHPDERTLILAKSSHTLSKVFQQFDDDETFINLDNVEEFRRVLKSLHHKFAKYLEEINELPKHLGYNDISIEDEESATYFHLNKVKPEWKRFLTVISEGENPSDELITEKYPFKAVPGFQEYIDSASASDNHSLIKTIINHYIEITQKFSQIATISSIFKISSFSEQVKFLWSTLTKVIGLTISEFETYKDHISGFDNVITLESSQMDEFETLHPIISNTSIKKVTLFGNVHSDSPEFSKLSLFEKWYRRDVSTVQLEEVYNGREEIVHLRSPPATIEKSSQTANSAMLFTTQLIQVKGPVVENIPGFYQNIEEAQFAIAIYYYLVSRGYPPKSIAILTTFEGQRVLLEEMAQHHIDSNTTLPPPFISTVSDFNNNSRDIVICSFVLETVDYFDNKQITSAVSSARLGFYALASPSMISYLSHYSSGCKKICEYGHKLKIVPAEKSGQTQRTTTDTVKSVAISTPEELFNYIADGTQ